MKQKTAGKLFLQAILSLVLLFALVHVIISSSGNRFVELFVLVFLLFLTVVGLANYKSSGERLLFAAFLLHALNVFIIWSVYNSFFFVLLLISLIGILVSRPRRASGCEDECSCEDVQTQPMVSSPPPQKVEVQPVMESKEKASAKTAAPKAKFTPGKYVASKRSNVYHEAKCDWAKKIQKGRQLWFASREEALNKGYKKHSCVN